MYIYVYIRYTYIAEKINTKACLRVENQEGVNLGYFDVRIFLEQNKQLILINRFRVRVFCKALTLNAKIYLVFEMKRLCEIITWGHISTLNADSICLLLCCPGMQQPCRIQSLHSRGTLATYKVLIDTIKGTPSITEFLVIYCILLLLLLLSLLLFYIYRRFFNVAIRGNGEIGCQLIIIIRILVKEV
jgi:hypothetical protein